MTTSKALRRCSACGFGITAAITFCPECGERQQPAQRGWRAKIFGEPPDRPETCHRDIERRASEILAQVTRDIRRFERQRDNLQERATQARAAARSTTALDESLRLVEGAIVARRRLEAQGLVALADVQLERIGNSIELYAQGDDNAAAGSSVVDWRRVGHTSSLARGASFVPTFAASPDARWIAAASKDGHLRVRDMARGAEVVVSQPNGGLTALAFMPDGRRLVGGGADGEVRVWDATSWTEQERIGHHPGGVRVLVVAPDGSWLATAGKDRFIRFWDAAERRESFALGGHDEAIQSLAVTSNGTWMASGSWDGVLKLWNLRKRVEQGSIVGHVGGILSLAFHPDGARLASGGWDKTVRIWSFREGQTSRAIGAHELGVLALAFSPDGRWLASGGGDRAIKVWSAEGFDAVVTLRGASEPVLRLAFSPNGTTLYSSGDAGIRVWSPVLPAFAIYDDLARIARLAARSDGMQCIGGPAVVMRAHRLMGRVVQGALARLGLLATRRGEEALDALPQTRDLEDAADRLFSHLRGMDVETSLREPLDREIRMAVSARSDLAGHAALAAATRLVRETEEQIAGLETADDHACEERLQRLRGCEERAARFRAALSSSDGDVDATATRRAADALQGLVDQIPALLDVVLARQATAIVARVAPIADQQPLVSLRRLHDALRTAVASAGGTAPDVTRSAVAGSLATAEADRGNVLAALEERYRELSSELEAVMEVDDLLRGKF